MKDWTGNKNSIYACIAANNHSKNIRDNDDYYATNPKAAELLLEVEPDLKNIWECACGGGHLAGIFEKFGKLQKASDKVYRGYNCEIADFLMYPDNYRYNGDIITNPPYRYAREFVEKALKMVADGRKVCMFLKLTFLEGKERGVFYESNPPQTVYVFRSRINCAYSGDFKQYHSSAVAYAWFVWEKGYKGGTKIKWIN